MNTNPGNTWILHVVDKGLVDWPRHLMLEIVWLRWLKWHQVAPCCRLFFQTPKITCAEPQQWAIVHFGAKWLQNETFFFTSWYCSNWILLLSRSQILSVLQFCEFRCSYCRFELVIFLLSVGFLYSACLHFPHVLSFTCLKKILKNEVFLLHSDRNVNFTVFTQLWVWHEDIKGGNSAGSAWNMFW